MIFRLMIIPLIYTTDNGQTYKIEFERTKDNISFEHHKTVKYLSYEDLLKLRDQIEKITVKFKNNEKPN